MKTSFPLILIVVVMVESAEKGAFMWQRYADSPTLPPSMDSRRELRRNLISMDTRSLSAQDINDIDKLIHALDLRNGDVNSISLRDFVVIVGVIGILVLIVFWFVKYPFSSRSEWKRL